MGTKEDIAYLEEERKMLWSEVEKLRGQVKKIAPETVQSILEKSEQINELTEQTNKIYASIVEKNQQCSINTSTILENATESSSKLTLIQNLHKQSEELFQKASTNSTELINLSESSKEIKTTLDTTLTEIKTKREALAELNTIFETATGTEEKIKLAHTNIVNYHKEIQTLHRNIFGYIEVDEEGNKVKVTGLEDDLEAAYISLETELNELHKDIDSALKFSASNSLQVQKHWESEHSLLKDKIKSLLPEALTAGLSHAYEKKKIDELEVMEKSGESFKRAIYGLIIISLLPFATSLYMLLFKGTALDDVIFKLPRMVVAILPLYVPVLWMAYTSSKKVNLSKRLIEEYAHKEALSKTFEGLSGQINNLKDGLEKDELRAKLLYNLLEVSAENPGKLIYDYNNADHPLMDALEKSVKLSEAITKLANIPGFSKLTNALVEKEKKIKADIEEKAEDGIEVSTDLNQASKVAQ